MKNDQHVYTNIYVQTNNRIVSILIIIMKIWIIVQKQSSF